MRADDVFYKSHHSPPSDKSTFTSSPAAAASFSPSSLPSQESTCKIMVDSPYGSLDVTQVHQLSNVIEIQNEQEHVTRHSNSITNNNNNNSCNNDSNNNSSNGPVATSTTQFHPKSKCGPLRCCKLAFSFVTSWLLDHILIPALDQVPKLHIYAGFTIAIASGKLTFISFHSK